MHISAGMVNSNDILKYTVIKSISFSYLVINKEKNNKQKSDIRYVSVMLATVICNYSCTSQGALKDSWPNRKLERERREQP